MSEQPIIYLDNAATTFPKPEVVYREMDSFYRSYGGNAGRGANPLARRAMALVNETRSMLQDWLSVPDIVFAPSATIALNTVIFGARLRRGDIVYVTPFEHNSVLRPVEHLRKTIGVGVRTLPFDKKNLACNFGQVRALFKLEPPTMVCITQASNVFGILLPVDEIVALARQASPSAVILVDGAQTAGLKPLNTSLIDAMVFSGHKSLYGPYGVAGITFGRNWRPEPLTYGGTGTRSESIDMPEEEPSRYESGSMNINAIAGLHAALCWLNETGRDAINAQIDNLVMTLIAKLRELPGITLYLPASSVPHCAIVSFNVDGASPQSIESALGAKGIAVRAGLHCSPWAHEFTGTLQKGGTVRVSVGHFNSQRDVNSFFQAIHMICVEFGKSTTT